MHKTNRQKQRVKQYRAGSIIELLESRFLLSSYTFGELGLFSNTNGSVPNGSLILDSTGNLYGTTYDGGVGISNSPSHSGYGVVYEIAKGSAKITDLAAFDGTDGQSPNNRLVLDSSGNLFGTTEYGGNGWTGSAGTGEGVLFEIVKGSGKITPVVSFNGTNGTDPDFLTSDADGNLFGTTTSGGAGWNGTTNLGEGTVFEIAKGSGKLTTLASFNGTNGDAPGFGLTFDSSGDIFGCTQMGGTAWTSTADPGYGAVFEIAKGTGKITDLASFDGVDGAFPIYGGVVFDGSGNLYGATISGGIGWDGTRNSGYGIVFEIAKGTKTFTTLASFNGTDGVHPYGGVILDSSGNLYGAAETGGPTWTGPTSLSFGTIFEVVKGSNKITVLASFNATNGIGPYAGLMMDANGDLYGTTFAGGAYYNGTTDNGQGTVFEVLKGSGTIIDLFSFDGTDGDDPGIGLIDSNGNIYGESAGGTGWNSRQVDSGYGTIFKLSPPHLVFQIKPVNGTAGVALGTVTINIENPTNQIITTDNSTITLKVGTGPQALTVSAKAKNGVATFSNDLIFKTAGTYTLLSTGGSDVYATSNSFTISPAAVAHLAFVQNPTNVVAGTVISPAVTVHATDAFGNSVAHATIILTLASGAGTLFGTISVGTNSAGIATFGNLSIRISGSHTLIAADGVIKTAASKAFTVAPAVAAKLVFTTLPAAPKHGTAYSLKVSVEDQFGNVLTGQNTGTISITLAAHPAGAILSGTLTANVIKGVATFSNLSVNLAGTYSLKATDSFAIAGATSSAIVVS